MLLLHERELLLPAGGLLGQAHRRPMHEWARTLAVVVVLSLGGLWLRPDIALERCHDFQLLHELLNNVLLHLHTLRQLLELRIAHLYVILGVAVTRCSPISIGHRGRVRQRIPLELLVEAVTHGLILRPNLVVSYLLQSVEHLAPVLIQTHIVFL